MPYRIHNKKGIRFKQLWRTILVMTIAVPQFVSLLYIYKMFANDGLVNTVSARAPLGAPQQTVGSDGLAKGVWNVLPDLHADHGFFQGGFMNRQDPGPFFDSLLELLSALG